MVMAVVVEFTSTMAAIASHCSMFNCRAAGNVNSSHKNDKSVDNNNKISKSSYVYMTSRSTYHIVVQRESKWHLISFAVRHIVPM